MGWHTLSRKPLPVISWRGELARRSFFHWDSHPPSNTHSTADDAQVTLSIEGPDGKLTPSGWSTRKEGGGDGRPFSFTPGQNLIAGWSEGVLKMREGERALLHVPAAKGYGASPQGSKGGGWYIPGNSNREIRSRELRPHLCPPPFNNPRTTPLHTPSPSAVLFDIEIVSKAGKGAPAKE